MCFSATASFAAGTFIGAVGVASLKRAETSTQKMFAGIPLLFAIQQFSEGLVWLSLSTAEPPPYKQTSIAAFLLFALVIWPVWVSVSMMVLEKNKTRKLIQVLSLLSGLTFSAFAGYYMTQYQMTAKISSYHILYELDFPHKENPVVPILYVMATVVPLLISSIRRVSFLGGLIFISYLVSRVYFMEYVISVWCFFAAVISSVIYLMVSDKIKVFDFTDAKKAEKNHI